MKENDKMMFSSVHFYHILFYDFLRLYRNSYSLSSFKSCYKWSFKGLLLRIYLKYPGKVTISYCTLYFHISNSILTEKKMHNVLGQDIKNLLLDQCIQKRSLRKKIKTPCWQFPHSNFITEEIFVCLSPDSLELHKPSQEVTTYIQWFTDSVTYIFPTFTVFIQLQ